ncbi:MAG: hypothetical protein H6R19_698 [Proteobacteria bacterium]|nr:hypothetical protein [Pseudomonadota bacterium]
MNRLFAPLICVGLLFAQVCAAAETVSFSFAGCVDSRERPVASQADPALPVLVETRLVEGNRVIFYNPSLLPQLLPETRAFLYAHECAWTRLGMPIDLVRSEANAHRADCWAANTLLRSKLVKGDTGLDAIEADLALAEAESARLPAPPRALALSSCVATKPAPRAESHSGTVLKLNENPASPAWNACMQACGNRLYACGRSSNCTTSFDQCTAGCANK